MRTSSLAGAGQGALHWPRLRAISSPLHEARPASQDLQPGLLPCCLGPFTGSSQRKWLPWPAWQLRAQGPCSTCKGTQGLLGKGRFPVCNPNMCAAACKPFTFAAHATPLCVQLMQPYRVLNLYDLTTCAAHATPSICTLYNPIICAVYAISPHAQLMQSHRVCSLCDPITCAAHLLCGFMKSHQVCADCTIPRHVHMAPCNPITCEWKSTQLHNVFILMKSHHTCAAHAVPLHVVPRSYVTRVCTQFHHMCMPSHVILARVFTQFHAVLSSVCITHLNHMYEVPRNSTLCTALHGSIKCVHAVPYRSTRVHFYAMLSHVCSPNSSIMYAIPRDSFMCACGSTTLSSAQLYPVLSEMSP